MDDLQIDQFISFNSDHVKLAGLDMFAINQRRKQIQFEKYAASAKRASEKLGIKTKQIQLISRPSLRPAIESALQEEAKKNGNFGPTAKNALIEIKKQNQITQDFIKNFVDPPEEKEVQNQQESQNQKDIQIQLISINKNFRVNTQSKPDHISLPLTNQPFIQIIDIQEYFPLWLQEYQQNAIQEGLKIFSFNNTEGLQNFFVNIDISTIKLMNQFLISNTSSSFTMTKKNIEKLQFLDDTIYEVTNNSIRFQESYINFAIDHQSINLSQAINTKINQDLKMASEIFNSTLPLADQRNNQIELNAFDIELDHQYWQELLQLNHIQMLNTIVFYSNSELKQIKYNIQQPIFSHPRFKKILIRDLLQPLEQDENIPLGYNKIEISEPLQRLYRTTKSQYEKTLLYQLIQGKKISLEECFKLSDQEFKYYLQSFSLLISLTDQIDNYWEKISGLNFKLKQRLLNNLIKLREQTTNQLITINKKTLKDSLSYHRNKKEYTLNEITEFYRRQIHTIIITNTDLQARQSQSHLEFIQIQLMINNLQLNHVNLHLNMQLNNQWQTLEQILNLQPSFFQGDFNIATLHENQSNPQKKALLKKIFSQYQSTYRGTTKKKQQLDYCFINKTQAFLFKSVFSFKFNELSHPQDHASLFTSGNLLLIPQQKQVTKNLNQLILSNPLLQYKQIQLDQPSKQQQFNSILLQQDLSKVDYINPPNLMKWKKQIDIDQWNLQLKHEVDKNQFNINPIIYEESIKFKKGDGRFNSKNYQLATKHDAEDLGREVQRISNQEQEDDKINKIVYQQFNKEFNQEQLYKDITLTNERRYIEKNQPFIYQGRALQSNPFILQTDIEIQTDLICTLKKLNYVNPTKATGRNSIPCSFMTLLTKLLCGKIMIPSRIYNYYNNVLQYRNQKNKVRATQYLIKKQQGNFFKLRGLEIPNFEQKIFGNSQTTIPKPTSHENQRYQFAYEKDTGTQKALENFVNFIQRSLDQDQEIIILVLDAEGGFNRSDKANAIQSMNHILNFNHTRQNIINTIGDAQIEEMNQPIGTSRQYPLKNLMFQTNGVPQGSSTSPETYCISIDQGIKDFIQWQEDQNDLNYTNKLVNAYMDDLILVYTMKKNNQFWEKNYNLITNRWIDYLMNCIKRYNPGYEINITKTEKIAIRSQQQQNYYQYQFRTRNKDDKESTRPQEFLLDDLFIEIDKSFKYLGLHFNFGSDNFIDDDIRQMLDKINRYQNRNIQSSKLIKKGVRSKFKTLTFDQYFMEGKHYNDPIEQPRRLQSQPQPILSEPFMEYKFINNIKDKLQQENNINLYQNLFYELESRERVTDINKKMKISGIQQKMMFPHSTLTTQKNQEFSENYKGLEEQQELNEQQKKNFTEWQDQLNNQFNIIQIFQ
ncbi:hypothetical protein ABPG72_002907 [Tetrahymena utriculariae]